MGQTRTRQLLNTSQEVQEMWKVQPDAAGRQLCMRPGNEEAEAKDVLQRRMAQRRPRLLLVGGRAKEFV